MFKKITCTLFSVLAVLAITNCNKSNKTNDDIKGLFAVPTADCLDRYDCRPSERYLNRISRDNDYVQEYPRQNSATPYYQDYNQGYNQGLCGCPAGFVAAYESGSLLCMKLHEVHESKKLVTWNLDYSKSDKSVRSSERSFINGGVHDGYRQQGPVRYDGGYHGSNYNNGNKYVDVQANDYSKRKTKEKLNIQFQAQSTERVISRKEIVTPTCAQQVVQSCDDVSPCGGGYSCQTYPQKTYGLCGGGY